MTSTEGLVPVGQRRRERRGLIKDVVDRPALALKDRHDRLGNVVDLVRIKCAKHRSESADQCVKVQRRFGALDRDRAARRQPLCAVAAPEFHVTVADQVLIADRGGSAVEQRQRTVDAEFDLHLASAVHQFHAGDLADLDPGGPDELARAQPTGATEYRRVSRRAVEPKLTEHHDDYHREQQQHQRERGEPDDSAGHFHGLIVFSPTWRPQMYSIASGWPSSKWL